MVSIGSLRYDIVADTTQFTKGVVATRKEISAAKKVFLDTRTPAEKLAIEIEGLNRVYSKVDDIKTYNRALKSLKQQHDIAQGGVKGLVAQFQTMPAAMKTAVKGFVAYRAAGMLTGQVRAGLAGAMEMETTIANFQVLTGSVAEANRLVGALRQYDVETTFSFGDTTKATKTLLNFGLSTQQVLPTLKQLGDVALGDSEKMHRLALAFGQATSLGRLQGQDLKQMIEVGWNPLQQITARTGETMAEVQERMRKGGIAASELALALKDATSEGGQFYGAVDEAAKTTGGQIKKLRGEWEQLRNDTMKELTPTLRFLVKGGRASLGALDTDFEKGSVQKTVHDAVLAYLTTREGAVFHSGEVVGDEASEQMNPAQAGFELAQQKRRAARAKAEAEALQVARVEQDKLINGMKGVGEQLFGGVFGDLQQIATDTAQQAGVNIGAWNPWEGFRNPFADPDGERRKAALKGNKPGTDDMDKSKDLAPTLKRGSREEYQVLAKLRSGAEAEKERKEQKRHEQAQNTLTTIAVASQSTVEWLGKLFEAQPEAVGG